MDELKPCHCGGSATLWTAPFGDYIKCNKCGEAVTFLDFDDEKLKSAWNRRPVPENKPLALDQLRQMDGEPVWCDWINGWGIVHIDSEYRLEFTYSDGSQNTYNELEYCNIVPLAYARKPEQEGKK